MRVAVVVYENSAPGARQVIFLQYTPESLIRTLQVQSSGGDSDGQRGQPYRLKSFAVETYKLDAELDATDRLENPELHPVTALLGITPDLAALEELVNPPVGDILKLKEQSEKEGVLEIVPKEAPLTLLVWGRSRIQPVRVTEFSVTEEAFGPGLNPIRAKVSLGFRVLTADDLGYGSAGGELFLGYMKVRQAMGKIGSVATAAAFAVDRIRERV